MVTVRIPINVTILVLMIPKGKGYADLATLEFLSLVHSARPLMPILGVVDCDPHGIEIMRTYKYGSQRLSHEENARVPGLQWLGVKMDNILGASRPAAEEDGSQSSLVRSSQSSQSSLGQFSQESQGSALLGKQRLTQSAWRLHTDQCVLQDRNQPDGAWLEAHATQLTR